MADLRDRHFLAELPIYVHVSTTRLHATLANIEDLKI